MGARRRAEELTPPDEQAPPRPTCPNSHHIDFRSHGGGDEEANRTSLSLAHHLHGVHQGHVRVRGIAPDALHWELGEVE